MTDAGPSIFLAPNETIKEVITVSEKNEKTESIAYKGIVSFIMDGKIQPGKRLAEQQIADELKISRTPVRNAMRSLSREGLLENRGSGGYILSPLSIKDVKKLFKVKLLVEPAIAAEAAQNAPTAEKDCFEKLLERERECYFEGKRDLYAINREIHCGIARLTGNKHMSAIQTALFWPAELYILFFDTFYHGTPERPLLRDPDRSVSYKGHVELVESVFARDARRAKKACTDHIIATWEMLRKNIASLKEGYGRMIISDWEEDLPEKPE